jgi:hypothetical protein
VIAISTRNQLSSVNKAEVQITITGTPAPKIKDIILSNAPNKELIVDPRDGYIATSPVTAQVNSETGEPISQDVTFSLTSTAKVPS